MTSDAADSCKDVHISGGATWARTTVTCQPSEQLLKKCSRALQTKNSDNAATTSVLEGVSVPSL